MDDDDVLYIKTSLIPRLKQMLTEKLISHGAN